MARTDTLSNYLTDIATAIKTKKSDETPINASKFDEEIVNLPTGEDIYDYWENTVAISSILSNPIVRFIKKIPPITTSNLSNMSNAFQYFESLIELPQIDTSKITKMPYMFAYCYKLKNVPLLDTTNVTDMSYICRDCKELEEISFTDTTKVTNMVQAFSGCTMLSKLQIDNFNTSNVTQINYCFSNCTSLKSLPLLNFSKIIALSSIFFQTTELTELGGFYNLGQAYTTTASANYSSYTLDLHYCTNLTHDSIMNVINNLYDIASKGCNTQKLQLGDLSALLTPEEIVIATNKGWTVS